MTRFADHLTSFSDILSSTAEDGEIRVNIGVLDTGEGWGSEESVQILDGFFSMPNDSVDDPSSPDYGACSATVLRTGDDKVIIGTHDNRYTTKTGNMQPGDRMIVSRGEARFFLKAESDSLSLYTKDADGNPLSVIVDPVTKQVNISVGGSEGTSTFSVKSGEINLAAGGTTVTINADGFSVGGAYAAFNVGGGHLGMVGINPAVAPMSYGVSPTVAASTSWTISP